jgi:hypothetical protein
LTAATHRSHQAAAVDRNPQAQTTTHAGDALDILIRRILLEDVSRGRDELLDHAGIDRRPAGADLDRSGTEPQRAGEERSRSTGITASADQHVNDLAALIDGAVKVGPAAGDLDVGLLDEPTDRRSRDVPGGRYRSTRK